MKVVKAVTVGKRIKPPAMSDDEAYLRLGVPSGVETDGSHPTTCGVPHDAINGPQNPHNVNKVEKVMHEYKEDTLHSGSRKGPVVRSRKQAVAIALSEQRKANKKG